FSLHLSYAVRFFYGVLCTFPVAAIMAMVQELIPSERRSEGTGYLALGTTVSAAIGPALALFVLGTFDYRVLFVIVLGISIVSLIASLIIFFRTTDPEPELDENGELPEPVK